MRRERTAASAGWRVPGRHHPPADPAFRRLWLAEVVTVVGAQLTVVAVPAQLYALTGSSAYVGLSGVFGLVPLIVFGLSGGAIADVVDRRMLLVVSGAGIALTSLLLFLTAVTGVGGVWTVLVVFAVQQACLAVNQPTRSAVLPRILALHELPAANTLSFTVVQLGAIAGPLLAGVALAFVDLGVLYLVDTVCLLASIWAAFRLPRLSEGPDAAARPLPVARLRAVLTTIHRDAGLRSIADGFRYAATSKVLLVSFLVDMVAMAVGMPRAVFPEWAERWFGDPPGGGPALGLLFASIAIGAALGGLLSGRLNRIRRQGVAVTLMVCVWGLGVAAAGVAPSLWLAVTLLGVAGAADLVSSVFRQTMLQVVATDEMRGRMQGVYVVVVAGGPRLGDLWHGLATAAIGTSATVVAGGLGVVAITIGIVAASPVFWRYRAPLPGNGPDIARDVPDDEPSGGTTPRAA